MEKEILDRLFQDFKDLEIKIERLKKFILDDEGFNKLDNLNKDLLIAQLKAMETYFSIITIRLGLNNTPSGENNTLSTNE